MVQFADGVTLRAKFAELAIRRREVEDELAGPRESLVTPGEDLGRFVIYCCSVGSRAFGLATAESDEDIRGVYLPPAAMTWSLHKAAFATTRLPDRPDYDRVNEFLIRARRRMVDA